MPAIFDDATPQPGWSAAQVTQYVDQTVAMSQAVTTASVDQAVAKQGKSALQRHKDTNLYIIAAVAVAVLYAFSRS